jgi:hypothetical protein
MQQTGVSTLHPRDDRDDSRLVQQLAGRERRRARTAQSLSALYSARGDIRGVSAVADLVVDATSWCA